MIVERNYVAMKYIPSFHYADLILSLHHCIVLLALHEMYDHWDLETFITRMVAVGFQCSLCYVIAHGIGAPSRYKLWFYCLWKIHRHTALDNLPWYELCYKHQWPKWLWATLHKLSQVLLTLTRFGWVTNVILCLTGMIWFIITDCWHCVIRTGTLLCLPHSTWVRISTWLYAAKHSIKSQH